MSEIKTMNKGKVDAENELLKHIKHIGLEWWAAQRGEGVSLNNVYYCFYLKNGEQRYWCNPSAEFLEACKRISGGDHE